MTFQATDNVSRGGCLVRTNFGTVDGRRETKAALLKEALAA
jgi:flagellar biosynthesis/type III secretory pathway protein FliH